MGMLDFLRSGRWFGDDEAQGPTPLFPPGVTTDKQSLFPVSSDKSPITPSPTGPSGGGWGAVSSWLNAPAFGDDKGADPQGLMAYKPQSRLAVLGDALSGAAEGVLGQRGPYANPLGGGLLGAGKGLGRGPRAGHAGRKLAFEAQAKQAETSLARIKTLTELKKANQPDTVAINGQLVDKATGQPVGAAIPPQAEPGSRSATTPPAGSAWGPTARPFRSCRP